MEPRIQYATTADGVSIAYWSIGEGLPLVDPAARDSPGATSSWSGRSPSGATGTSTSPSPSASSATTSAAPASPTATSPTLASTTQVARPRSRRRAASGSTRFALFGMLLRRAPVAIAYAAKHPERVSHLILWCALRDTSESHAQHRLHDTRSTNLLERDYDLFTETLAHTVFGWEEGESAHRLARVHAGCALARRRRARCWAVNQDHRRDAAAPVDQRADARHAPARVPGASSVDTARRLAARIPDARLLVLDGASLSPVRRRHRETSADHPRVRGRTSAAPVQRPPHAHPHEQRGARAGGLPHDHVHRHGGLHRAHAAPRRRRRRRRLVRLHNDDRPRCASTRFGGTQVKHTGDGIMASFPTASRRRRVRDRHPARVRRPQRRAPADARRRAHRHQRRRARRRGRRPLRHRRPARVARLRRAPSRARSSTSDVVRQLVAGKGFLFADRGETELRGFEDPVRLYEVRWRERQPRDRMPRSASAAFDLIIRNGTVYDGSGGEPYVADIGVTGDRIAGHRRSR